MERTAWEYISTHGGNKNYIQIPQEKPQLKKPLLDSLGEINTDNLFIYFYYQSERTKYIANVMIIQSTLQCPALQ